MKYLKHLFLIFLMTVVVHGRTSTEVSLLTCDKGGELYSTFGHSAIRINSGTGKDAVYDFGIFDFHAPNFIYHFLKGDLEYRLELRSYNGFVDDYIEHDRAIVEQKINLTVEETRMLIDMLHEIYESDARYYRYNFLHNNCSTRIRDLLLEIKPNTLMANEAVMNEMTYRDYLKLYLEDKEWLELGVDILLGSPTDEVTDPGQSLFLPQPLSYQLAELPDDVDEKLLERGDYNVFKLPKGTSTWKSPVFVVSLVSFLILIFTMITGKGKKWFLSFLLFVLGVVGVVLLLMWMYSLHEATWWNANLIWANPLYLLFPFFLFNRFRSYFLLGLIGINGLFLIGNWMIPQYFNPAVFPVIILMLTLAFMIYRADRKEKNAVSK